MKKVEAQAFLSFESKPKSVRKGH